MISYKDMTFCVANCSVITCHRYITDKLRQDAEEFGLGIAQSDFSTSCSAYTPNETET